VSAALNYTCNSNYHGVNSVTNHMKLLSICTSLI